jgi:hypothetical protein
MRRGALVFTLVLAACPLAAQDAAAPAPAPAEAPAAPSAPEAVAPAAPERKFTAEIETGYRFVQDVGGNRNVYRSIVNLGEGPKLFNARANYRNPGGHWMDRLDLRADSWGGEPYNTGRLEAGLAGAYAFRVDYKNIAYFNSLPSYANPLLASGVLLSERAFDLRRRDLDTQLDLRPGARISPYLAFSHNSGFGRGITTFVTDGNEFPLATDLRDSTESYRGGVHLNFTRFNFTLEQGGTTFKDDQQITFAGRNLGNRTNTLLGQTIALQDLRQLYGARGSGIYNRGLVQGRPWTRWRFQGQFLYSQPSIDVRQTISDRGTFLLLAAVAPYTSLTELSIGEAQRPRPSGSWSNEFLLHRRLRVIESWSTDRFHVSGSAVLAQTYNTVPVTNLAERASELLVMNYNQHQVDAIVDVTSSIVLRGGHRYVWGDVTVPTPSLLSSPSQPTRPGELRRQVALAGGTLRFRGKVDINLDLEASPGDKTYLRTDLKAYQRGRVRGRYQIRPSWTLAAAFSGFHNRNDAPGVNLEQRSQQSSVSLAWAPNQGKRFTVLADYSRSTLRSDLPYLEPQTQDTALSHYRDDGHHGGAYVEVHLARNARLNLGGSYSINTGSRPTRYYQPQAQVLLPLAGKVTWTADWRWYGFTERRYAFENFHTHTFATGLRLGL